MAERKRTGAFTRVTSPHAKALRNNMTDAEQMLWQRLRDRRLGGHKFRRQVTIDPFIVDFLCIQHRLIVEVDGGQHAEQIEHDVARTAWLETQGYRVLRFWNNEVLGNRDGVTQVILNSVMQAVE